MNTMQNTLARLALAGLIATSSMASVAVADDDQVRGRDFMNNIEWQAHRDAMMRLDSQQQRQLYRKAVHEQMSRRAQDYGMELTGNPSGKGCLSGNGRGKRYEL